MKSEKIMKSGQTDPRHDSKDCNAKSCFHPIYAMNPLYGSEKAMAVIIINDVIDDYSL